MRGEPVAATVWAETIFHHLRIWIMQAYPYGGRSHNIMNAAPLLPVPLRVQEKGR
jgi:hypothetical protein